jgi:uncharacterized protein YutE (UPF0331/DUF86 family)
VVLRPEAVRARLLRLEEVTTRLEQLAAVDARTLQTDFRQAWAVERGLQLAAEIVFDVGNHILSAHFGVSAQDYEDILGQLEAHRVIPAMVRDRLKGLGGFRNILVHGYLALDPERVARSLSRAPGDFSEFAAAIRQWMETTRL